MAWTSEELTKFARKCSGFVLELEWAPWDEKSVSGEGINKLLFAFHEKGQSFPAFAVANAFYIAQEWANRMGEEVRLVINGTHRGSSGGGHWGVKTFRPVPGDGRTPQPLAVGGAEPVVIEVATGEFIPLFCAHCLNPTVATLLGVEYNNGCILHLPLCSQHREQAEELPKLRSF